jgi:hypothetical protein
MCSIVVRVTLEEREIDLEIGSVLHLPIRVLEHTLPYYTPLPFPLSLSSPSLSLSPLSLRAFPMLFHPCGWSGFISRADL